MPLATGEKQKQEKPWQLLGGVGELRVQFLFILDSFKFGPFVWEVDIFRESWKKNFKNWMDWMDA